MSSILRQATQLWAIMSWRDFATLLASGLATFALGFAILYVVFQRFFPAGGAGGGPREMRQPNNRIMQSETIDFPPPASSTGGTLPSEVEQEVARRVAATPAHVALAERRKAGEAVVASVRRNIPLGASATLVQKGTRLVEEGAYDEALVCFLALLYSAVENGKAQPDSLPAHLAECLRGAGTCYRRMNQIEVAAKFFQAERLIYEEMVAGLSSNIDGDATKDKTRAIVASLFKDDIEDSLPRRCRVLKEVAAQCMKHGHVQVALSYHLKTAALKRKASGKPMDATSEEFAQIAEMLRQLSPAEVAAATAAAGISENVHVPPSAAAAVTAVADAAASRRGASPSESKSAASPTSAAKNSKREKNAGAAAAAASS